MGKFKGSDLLVKLYNVKDDPELMERLAGQGVRINRIFPPDYGKLRQFIRENFSENWAHESESAMANHPASCFVAVKDHKIVGFACYNATAKDYFGPTGVSEECRGLGIGKALLLKCMLALREEGYGYAIIGWSDDATPFYEKVVGAVEIPDSIPGIYGQMVGMD